MNYWLFTVTQKKVDGETLEAEDIFNQRTSDEFWGLGERTPNRRSVRRGDRVVFYVGWPLMFFAATATLASDSFSLSDEQKDLYGHGKAFYRSDYGVELEDIVWKCANCGTENRNHRSHCWHCAVVKGASPPGGLLTSQTLEATTVIERPSICSTCSAPLKEDAKFCPLCAAAVPSNKVPKFERHTNRNSNGNR
jgi:hypothetical protein